MGHCNMYMFFFNCLQNLYFSTSVFNTNINNGKLNLIELKD